MRLLLVNSVCGIRSTGRIVADIAKALEMDFFSTLTPRGETAAEKGTGE